MTPNEQNVAKAQAKYGKNHWWESTDPRVIGYYQVNEPILIVQWPVFHEAIEALLGRDIQLFEFGVNIAGLRQEAQAAWGGTPYSEELRQQAERDAFGKLIARKGANNVIVKKVEEE